MGSLSVCVFCSSACGIAPHYIRLAERTGAGIAKRGWVLVSGGENISMMGAVARGARNNGGATIGVVPDVLLARADRECNELVVTSSMADRKVIMTERSDALLALPGGLGTCEELFQSWTSRMLDLHTKPLILLDPDGHFAELMQWIDSAGRRGFISTKSRSMLYTATTVDEALARCMSTAAATPATATWRVP